jgi:glycosyltransferase involved in cell wall biosynthesis
MNKPLISVIVTVLNEGKHLRDLLESLVVQEGPYEVIVVDAGSTDSSQEIVRRFGQEFPGFRLLVAPGSRGFSRNHGVERAQGEYIAFIDGDCIANAFWLKHLREQAAPGKVVAGRSVRIGYWAFERLERVELLRRGYDITFPSSNLLYPRAAFQRLDGFDARFVTAEDIDLNFRAVEAGLAIVEVRDAIVYARARDSVSGFLRQAYWNGYGRKQLTLKHGGLWSEYSLRRMFNGQVNFWPLMRMTSAVVGYLTCLMRENKRQWRGVGVPQTQAVVA